MDWHEEGLMYHAKTSTWLREYYSTIGASQAATVVGASPASWNSTPLSLYEKMREVRDRHDPLPTDPNSDMLRGILLEPIARQLLSLHIGPIREHDQDEFVYSERYPWAHALPDGWTQNGSIVEIKVPRPVVIGKLRRSGIPQCYMIQCQHAMAVCGVDECVFAALDPVNMDLEIIPVDRDDELIGQLMQAEQQFFNGVLSGQPPAEESSVAIDLPEDVQDLETIETPVVVEAARHYARCKSMSADAAALEEAAQNRLVTAVGDSQGWLVPGVGIFRYNPQEGRKNFDKDTALADLKKLHAELKTHDPDFPDLDVDKYFKKSKPSRPFRPYLFTEE